MRFALAMLLVLVQVGGYFHGLAADHQICPEHGEVLEGGGGHESVSVGLSAATDSRDAQVRSLAKVGLHEECTVIAHLRRGTRVAEPVVVPLPRPSSIAVPVVVDAEPIRTIAVYRLAPKSSPPSAV